MTEPSKFKKKEKMWIAAIVGAVLMASFGSAAWMFYAQSSPSAMVVKSDQPITLVSDFSGINIDTSNSSAIGVDNFVFVNNNGNVSVNITSSEQFVDVNDDCTDWENDCTLFYEYEGQTINPPEQVTVTNGQHNVTLIYDCVRFACPQNASVRINISQNI